MNIPKSCPFCQKQLQYKGHMYDSYSFRCPEKHYDFHPLGIISEDCYQETIFFKDFMLKINYSLQGEEDDFYIIIYNKEKKKHPDEIKINKVQPLKPFMICYDYNLLKQKIETILTFQ